MDTENIDKCNKTNSDLTSNEIFTIPITIQETNVLDGARQILKVIRPTWSEKSIKFKLFTDGITNKLIGCSYNNLNEDEGTFSSENKDIILIRIYGNKTELLIDRTVELQNIKFLHKHGFAPRLYATFSNGLAYEYVPGVTLTTKTVCDPNISLLVARHMAKMHKIKIDSSNEQPLLWSKMQKFLSLLPEKYSNSRTEERVRESFPSTPELKNQFAELYKKLETLNSPIVFCHNDLLLANVIYEKSLDQIAFIDYEYAGQNFQAFDIGNHFTEFAGVEEIDYRRYPSKEFQLVWLRCYLETFHGPKREITDKDVDVLYIQVNQFALASHFLWVVWALIQAEYSTIDFDFVQFAQLRFTEYLTRKDSFLKLCCDE